MAWAVDGKLANVKLLMFGSVSTQRLLTLARRIKDQHKRMHKASAEALQLTQIDIANTDEVGCSCRCFIICHVKIWDASKVETWSQVRKAG